MDLTLRLDEPNIQSTTFFSTDKRYLFLKVDSWAANEEGSVHNTLVIQGTPDRLKTLIADEIDRACKKEVNLPQPTADEEGFEEMVRTHEAHKNNPEPKELPVSA